MSKCFRSADEEGNVVKLLCGTGFAVLLAVVSLTAGHAARQVRCSVYPALPRLRANNCSARQVDGNIVLANGFLAAEVSAEDGVITAVTNRLTGQRHALLGDQAGVVTVGPGGARSEWMARVGGGHKLAVKTTSTRRECGVTFTESIGGLTYTLFYSLPRDHFWIERRLSVKAGAPGSRFDRLVYGKLDTQGEPRVLKLGLYDCPRIVSIGDGGLFGGVGWWFYSVDGDGIYQNADMKFTCPQSEFVSEPWYVGIIHKEDGEEFPGWLWYKAFLHVRKSTYDTQKSWCFWNAGWGHFGLGINDPQGPEYIEMVRRLGINGICWGGMISRLCEDWYPFCEDFPDINSEKTDQVTRKNLELCTKYGIRQSFCGYEALKERFEDADLMDRRIAEFRRLRGIGYNQHGFDFFVTVNTFTAHWNVTRYYRAVHGLMDYQEHHLGMAEYGPQFQREVAVNHSSDPHGFPTPFFSADWVALHAWRHQERTWQENRNYIMPDYGFYYFRNHMGNWPNRRKFTDPEPTQFLVGPHGYNPILAINLHDSIGFRDAMAAVSAFSTFGPIGYIDLNMPDQDVRFCNAMLKWIAQNADSLRPARVCLEDTGGCVISKVVDGKGTIYAVNYSAGARTYRLKLDVGSAKPIRLREVYPACKDPYLTADGSEIALTVRGESVAIVDVNRGLKTLPPQNPSAFPIDLVDWREDGGHLTASVGVPDIRSNLKAVVNPTIPAKLSALDEVSNAVAAIDPNAKPDAANTETSAQQLAAYMRICGSTDGKTVDTWRVAPWAYADRVYLVYCPGQPLVIATDPVPDVTVNGRRVTLVPRIDYRSNTWNLLPIAAWKTPLMYADVTKCLKYGGTSSISISGDKVPPGEWYLMSAADRR